MIIDLQFCTPEFPPRLVLWHHLGDVARVDEPLELLPLARSEVLPDGVRVVQVDAGHPVGQLVVVVGVEEVLFVFVIDIGIDWVLGVLYVNSIEIV